ncbi:hypothetical protein [Ochrobactrum chromiisoli]|uniref:Uncharacterized protein n=1 Tax=Ochrobactrum chromiisoli TaxID=2993941 RepID=A0ABT3QSL0_9HYPH|nr:hypothetical protein [Ochrobactrum chromiisoli]MCX2698604.1 hypothetical protein [Ochrobactrum chromiisoli]
MRKVAACLTLYDRSAFLILDEGSSTFNENTSVGWLRNLAENRFRTQMFTNVGFRLHSRHLRCISMPLEAVIHAMSEKEWETEGQLAGSERAIADVHVNDAGDG